MAALLLFCVYTIILSLLLLRLPFVKKSAIPAKTLLFLFFIKIIGGLFDLYIAETRFYGGDAFLLHGEVMLKIDLLRTNPGEFWSYFFNGWTRFKFDENIYSQHNRVAFNDIGAQLNFRFMTVSSLLSFGHLYVNTLFYTFVFFIGQFALYLCFAQQFKAYKYSLLLCVFFIPSVWFWCSGIHKDGFVMSFMGFLLYYTYRYVDTKQIKYMATAFLFFVLVLLMRYYIIAALLPAFLLLLIALKLKRNAAFIFASGLLIYVIAFFNISKLAPGIDPPKVICIKQQEFYSLKGKSMIERKMLEPNANSFAKDLGPALLSVGLRPYMSEAKDLMYTLSSLEIILLNLLLLTLIVLNYKTLNHPLKLFSFFISLIMLIIIGYIVPFSGAFIRYRSEYFPFLFSAAIVGQPLIEKISTSFFAKLRLSW